MQGSPEDRGALNRLGQSGELPGKAGPSWMARVFMGTEEGSEYLHKARSRGGGSGVESPHKSTYPQMRKRGHFKFPLPENLTATCPLDLKKTHSLLRHKKGLKEGSITYLVKAQEVLYRRH